MSQNISWLGASYTGVPYITLPKTGGGTARFTDTTVTTASETDVASGKVFVKADGSTATGSLSFSTITTSSSQPSGGSNGDVWLVV